VSNPLPPVTAPLKRLRALTQPANQYRPNLSSEIDAQTQVAFRQTFDLIQAQRDAFSPIFLSALGDQTGPVIKVLVGTGANLGTSLNLNLGLTRPGTWLVMAQICLKIIGDTGIDFTLSLKIGNAPQPYGAVINKAANETMMITQLWQARSITGTENATLFIRKASGGGTSQVIQPQSTMFATWQGA